MRGVHIAALVDLLVAPGAGDNGFTSKASLWVIRRLWGCWDPSFSQIGLQPIGYSHLLLIHKVYQRLTRSHRFCLTRSCQNVSQGLASSHKVSQRLSRFHKVSQDLTRSRKVLQGLTSSHKVSQGLKVSQVLTGYHKVPQGRTMSHQVS